MKTLKSMTLRHIPLAPMLLAEWNLWGWATDKSIQQLNDVLCQRCSFNWILRNRYGDTCCSDPPRVTLHHRVLSRPRPSTLESLPRSKQSLAQKSSSRNYIFACLCLCYAPANVQEAAGVRVPSLYNVWTAQWWACNLETTALGNTVDWYLNSVWTVETGCFLILPATVFLEW